MKQEDKKLKQEVDETHETDSNEQHYYESDEHEHEHEHKHEHEHEQKGRIGRFFSKIYIMFIKMEGSPDAIAKGFGLGLFIAMTPTMGIQTYIAVPLAALFKVSKVSAALGVWLTNPLSAPFLYGFSYMVGAMILGYPFNMEVFSNTTWETVVKSSWQVLGTLIVGGIVTGTVFAIAGYFLVEGMIRKGREKAIQLKNKIKKVHLNKKHNPVVV